MRKAGTTDMFQHVSWLYGLVFLCAALMVIPPVTAGAAYSATRKDFAKITVMAYRDKSSVRLQYRVFTTLETPLPCTVTLPWYGGPTITRMQQSDGTDSWWPMNYSLRNETITFTLTKGRIAEFVGPASNIYTAKNGTVSAKIPLGIASGVGVVEVGATVPEGLRCISPANVSYEFQPETYLKVAKRTFNLVGGSPESSITFIFSGTALGAKQETNKMTTTITDVRRHGWCISALGALAFAMLLAWLLEMAIFKEDEPTPEEESVDEDVAPENEKGSDTEVTEPGLTFGDVEDAKPSQLP